MFKKIDDELTDIKYKVFGKVSIKKKKNGAHKVNELQSKKLSLEKVYSGEKLIKNVKKLMKNFRLPLMKCSMKLSIKKSRS